MQGAADIGAVVYWKKVLVDNYFESKELCTVYGQFYVPKSREDSLWIELVPRKSPSIDVSVEELHKLMDIFFDWEINVFNSVVYL